MFIIRADSLTHARTLAASDPMQHCGTRTFRVRPWLVNEGYLTLNLPFSDGRFRLV